MSLCMRLISASSREPYASYLMSLALSIGSHKAKGLYLSPISELDVLLTVVLSRDNYRARV